MFEEGQQQPKMCLSRRTYCVPKDAFELYIRQFHTFHIRTRKRRRFEVERIRSFQVIGPKECTASYGVRQKDNTTPTKMVGLGERSFFEEFRTALQF